MNFKIIMITIITGSKSKFDTGKLSRFGSPGFALKACADKIRIHCY